MPGNEWLHHVRHLRFRTTIGSVKIATNPPHSYFGPEQPKHREQFAHRSSITRRAHDDARRRMRQDAVRNAFYGGGRKAQTLDDVDVAAWQQHRRRESFVAQY